MNDDEKWLEAAAGLEQDILYLKAALQTGTNDSEQSLMKGIERLQTALAVYKRNAAAGIPWPSPDDLFCIRALSCAQVTTGIRRYFKFAS
jgi:hypothetical protein